MGRENTHTSSGQLYVGDNEFGEFGYRISAIACLNPKCKRVTLTYGIHRQHEKHRDWHLGLPIRVWRLLPESAAKPQPDFIPPQLRDDYAEACRIRDLSPKASATLARRCLQGMIRHFCGISKARLIDEINALRETVEGGSAPRGVTIESVDAIDHVRKIGNIGAHMEKDVDMIVDIEPGEAQALIELIEMLFDEWYVEQQNRAERLAKISAIGAEKSAARVPKPEAQESDVGQEPQVSEESQDAQESDV
ncbi:MAG: DUF4145 domain-containing protein [Methyloceanibacter sp.]